MSDNKYAKITAGYMINIPNMFESEIKQNIENIQTFIDQVDKLYVYNSSRSDHERFFEALKKYQNIVFANCTDYGEAEIYKELCAKGIEDNSDFVVLLKPGYFYEEGHFLELKRYISENDMSKTAVVTPMPLLGCETHERKAETHRYIKGCRLLGAFLNLHIYKQTDGIDTSYYQTTYDYDYCLDVRSKGYFVCVANNQVFRNLNYKVITRKILFLSLSTYDRDLMDVYYETRGRKYLWKKYKHIDPQYVKLDKKLYRQEKKEMAAIDKNYKDKRLMIAKANADYSEGIKGKYRGL